MIEKTINVKKRGFFIFTPIILIIVTQTTAIVLGKFLDYMVLIPIILIYWGLLVLFLSMYGIINIRKWLNKPQGHWIWIVIAIILGFSSLPFFIKDIGVFKDPLVLLLSITFFVINPWLEEFYWRGLLLDVTKKWPIWISAIYSSVLFTMWHSAFSWYSESVRSVVFYVTVLFLGFMMVLIYRKTKSLWLCIISHMLINIFNMGIPTIMNLIKT